MTDDEPTLTEDSTINDGDGLEIAKPGDFFHRRDSDDELQPVVQQVPGREEAMRVIPPTTGDYQQFHLDEDEKLYEDDDLFAQFVNKFFVDLDFEVTAEDVRDNLIAFGAEPMVDMVKRAGGQDMKDAMDEREIEKMMEYFGGDEGGMDFQALIEAGKQVEEDEEA